MAENGDGVSIHDGIQIMDQANRDELMSLKIAHGTRRLIVAMCENERGRFCKLTDSRARIIVPSEGISQMRKALFSLDAGIDSASPSSQETDPVLASGSSTSQNEDTKSELIDSARFLSEGRKFYFDVLANTRGRYLKISQSSTRRITLILPIAMLSSLKRAIDMLLDKVPPEPTASDPSMIHQSKRTIDRVTPMGDGTSVNMSVVQREIRVLGKRVVFESGANRRGSYLKIMESSGPQRMTVVLPHSAVPHVIELLQEVIDDGDPADNMSTVVENGQ